VGSPRSGTFNEDGPGSGATTAEGVAEGAESALAREGRTLGAGAAMGAGAAETGGDRLADTSGNGFLYRSAMARACATGSEGSAATSAPAGGVLSTRAGALRFRTGGPGSSDSRATGRGAAVVEPEEDEFEEGDGEADAESEDPEDPPEVGLRFSRGRSGSSSAEPEEDAGGSERSAEEPD